MSYGGLVNGKGKLIKSADAIGKISNDSIKEYMDKMEMLAARMNEIMLKRGDIKEINSILCIGAPNFDYLFLFCNIVATVLRLDSTLSKRFILILKSFNTFYVSIIFMVKQF